MLDVKLKVAVVPLKLAVEITVPSSTSDMEVIPVGGTPDSLRVKLLKVTTLVPGLVSWICCIVTLEAPATWVEFEGGLVPCEAWTVT